MREYYKSQRRKPQIAFVHSKMKYEIQKMLHEKMMLQEFNTKTGKIETRVGSCLIMETLDIEENEILII